MNDQNDIDIEIWMAHQAGMNDMYQDRVKSQKVIGEFDAANPAQKSINMNNQFIPMTMEQDISQRQALAQKADAAKFGYDPQVSTSAQVISFINKVNFLLGIIASLFATPLGMVVGVALNLMLYKAIEGWTQILDVKGLLGPSDQREILSLIGEQKAIANEVKKYEDYASMPKDLKKRLEMMINKQYAMKNNMQLALKKVKDTYK